MREDAFVTWLAQYLGERDPGGLTHSGNPGRVYEPQAIVIARTLPEVGSAGELSTAMWELFVDYFDASAAGPRSRYAPIAETVYRRWLARER